MMRCQHNAWIHLVATAMMIARRILLPSLAPGMVLDRGGFKHGVRIFGRRGITEFHPVVRHTKDVAAGTLLITALASSVIVAVIFGHM